MMRKTTKRRSARRKAIRRRENLFTGIHDNGGKLLTGAKTSRFSGDFALYHVTIGKSLNSLKNFSCDDSAQENAPKNQPQSQ